MALYDNLTGLANRTLLDDRMQQAFALAARERTKTALCFFDIDGLKAINDRDGHSAGDAHLCAFAERASKAIRRHDTFARVGGDEFILLCAGIQSETQVEVILERVGLELADSSIRASVGVSLRDCDSTETAAELIARADDAMYQAKRTNIGTPVFSD